MGGEHLIWDRMTENIISTDSAISMVSAEPTKPKTYCENFEC